jgi:hypothetical protein
MRDGSSSVLASLVHSAVKTLRGSPRRASVVINHDCALQRFMIHTLGLSSSVFTTVLACALVAAGSPLVAQTFPVRDVSPPGVDATFEATAVDPQGNAIVIWSYAGASEADRGHRSSRYSAATDTWSPPVELIQGPNHHITDVAMDAAGNAIAVGRRMFPATSPP